MMTAEDPNDKPYHVNNDRYLPAPTPPTSRKLIISSDKPVSFQNHDQTPFTPQATGKSRAPTAVKKTRVEIREIDDDDALLAEMTPVSHPPYVGLNPALTMSLPGWSPPSDNTARDYAENMSSFKETAL